MVQKLIPLPKSHTFESKTGGMSAARFGLNGMRFFAAVYFSTQRTASMSSSRAEARPSF